MVRVLARDLLFSDRIPLYSMSSVTKKIVFHKFSGLGRFLVIGVEKQLENRGEFWHVKSSSCLPTLTNSNLFSFSAF